MYSEQRVANNLVRTRWIQSAAVSVTRPRSIVSLVVGVVCAACVIGLVPSVVSASGITSRPMSGYQDVVACLSTRLCVVGGYTSRRVGDVVEVRDGVPGHVSTVKGTQDIVGISCPSGTGCIALARTSTDEGADLLAINAAGVVTGSKRVATSTGDEAERISCVSLTECETAGLDGLSTPPSYEIGDWNGKTLTLHKVTAPAGTQDAIVEGISCTTSTCDVVGYAEHGLVDTGISIRITHGSSFELFRVAQDLLYGVSCGSATRCYADGFDETGSVIVTLTDGKMGSQSTIPASDLYGIACTGDACTAVGKESSTKPSNDPYWGTIYGLSNGAVSSTRVVELSSGFNDVSRVGSTFEAVGSGQGAPSEVTTG